MDLPRDAASVSDIPDDFEPQPLGNRVDLIDAIREAAPSVDFSDPSWGELVTPTSSSSSTWDEKRSWIR